MYVNPRRTLVFLSAFSLSISSNLSLAKDSSQNEEIKTDLTFKARKDQRKRLIDTIWNKPQHQYRYGDQFTVTLVPHQKSYVYLFYISHDDKVMAIYPSRMSHKHTPGCHEPMEISTIKSARAEYALRVDSTPGKMISAAIKDSEQGKLLRDRLIGQSDWAFTEPQEHTLKMSGDELLERLKELSSENSEDFFYSIEDAPKAEPGPKPNFRTDKRPNGLAAKESGV